MGKPARITIALNEELSAAMEQARARAGQSRSAFIRDAIAQAIGEAPLPEEAERYLRGYRAIPEDDGEVAALNALGYAALAEEPWA